MFDVFYSGKKPNKFAHEQAADSIEHAQQLSSTRYFWWINYLADIDDVDFLWEPRPWEANQRHAWPSQWQIDSGVYLVPKTWDSKDTNYHIETIKRTAGIPIVEIDHLDGNAGHIPNTFKTVRYFDNYKDTLTRIARTLKGQHEYVWVCSSVCHYEGFDFSWHPDPWQLKLLHVFASNGQKFGDTFLMHVDSFAERIGQFALLDWYDVNFVDIPVPRRPMPVIRHNMDSQADAVMNTEWDGPLALFTTVGEPLTMPTVSLWRAETKTIVPLSAGASAVIVPKAAKGSVKTQLYDYPYIDKTDTKRIGDRDLDIVFISNGENDAEWLFEKIEHCILGLWPNKIHRVQNVKGRVAAYQAAARASTTPWFLAVFGKLEVSAFFPWDWQPDRMQQPKHYIFHAKNPINGLEYGHQAMIAYNKKLVLENTGQGLDFTLDQPHEVVPILSGTANYHTDNWMCWRTAFREVLKLKASLPDVENEYRLKVWLTTDAGEGMWSKKGAQDAVEFYEAVKGDPTELKKSYEWDWLASYAFMKRGLVPN